MHGDEHMRVPVVAEIDDFVFDLYGLTTEEREIVKGGEK